jgi:hypothetical protein
MFLMLYVPDFSNHISSLKVTVAAISMLSSEPHEYAVQQIMFSSTCKRETGAEHMQIIKTIPEACNRQRT